MSGRAFVALQKLLPQHALSRGVGALASSRRPWIRDPFITLFSRAYDVDLAEADVVTRFEIGRRAGFLGAD